MEEENIEIFQLNADTFEREEYKSSDTSLMVKSDLDTDFDRDRDYIEFYVYDENNNLIYPDNVVPLNSFNVKDGDLILNPINDLKSYGFDTGKYNILYNFYRKRLSSDPVIKYYIKEISSDRTEIRLASNSINPANITAGVEAFNTYRNLSPYFIDFYLNFGQNNVFIANNLVLDTSNAGDATVLIKLYEPLPSEYDIKSQCWVVEQLANPQLYQVNFPFVPQIIDDRNFISGPNFNLDVKNESGKAGQLFSSNELLNSDLTSSASQLKSLLSQKEINININYENFDEFINFSSAKTRLENFYYKVGLIESASKQITTNLNQITSATTSSFAFSSSKATHEDTINNIINNFDDYEYFLYYDSGSLKSYPKSNSTPPYKLLPTGSATVLNWLGSADPNSPYFGGLALSASNYDQSNQDWLHWAIPEYLRSDPENARYELFIDMVGQHYDNIWTYTKDITQKYNADNRIDFGLSKDIVAQAIRDFGIRLYSNNFNTDELYTAFLGLTPSGSLFPFPNITGSLPVNTGSEYVDTKISASNDVISLDDTNKRLYKRIYHNIPYLIKTKGTAAGLRALITSYGIPDTILRINEFGGKDKNENKNWDYKQRVFNYAFDSLSTATNYVTSSFNPTSSWGAEFGALYPSPQTVQFRFKTPGIPTGSGNTPSGDIRYSQSLWLADKSNNSFADIGAAVVLEYTGSGFVTGSYSGSVASPYDNWGTLKFYPNVSLNPTVTCSVFAPFFNKDWWSVQITFTGSSATDATASLFTANEIDGKVGFSGSDVKLGLDDRDWTRSDLASLNNPSNKTINSKVYKPFSGSYQEYRMFAPIISESKFYDYTLNPYSIEGNSVGSAPNELIFRAALGTQLNTGSGETQVSIHPKITGSAVQITQSFLGNTSNYYIRRSGTAFRPNVENIYQDQVIAGIKNRITDKIQTRTAILPENPSGSNATTTTLSPLGTIQQSSLVSSSYSPSVDYVEVAFSPQDQINDDINAQFGYFNIGEYIGDPRLNFSSSRSYPDLNQLRDDYFEKYKSNYNLVDFIRLIKFFDNSLFKMIKDFTPARTSLASGAVIKQHLLERNRQRIAQVTSSNVTYTGSIKPQSRNYSTGSSDFSQPNFTSGSSIYRFSGGTGGSFEQYNGLQTYNLDILRVKGNTNLASAFTVNTLNIPDGGDDFDNFEATYNGFYGTRPILVGSMIGTNDGGAFSDFNFFINSVNADFPVKIGDTITVLGSTLDTSGGSGQLVLTLRRSDVVEHTIESPNNRFGVTQSFSESIDNSIVNYVTNSGSFVGSKNVIIQNQEEFYDGEFSGSFILLPYTYKNPACADYLNVPSTPIRYNPIVFSFENSTAAQGTVTEEEFVANDNNPVSGDAWIANELVSNNPPLYKVKYIKLSNLDVNGEPVGDYLDDSDTISWIPSDASVADGSGVVEYKIDGVLTFANSTLLRISQTSGDNIEQTVGGVTYYPITSSIDAGSENWSLDARTSYKTTVATSQSNDNTQQGRFINPSALTQTQYFWFYNGTNTDAQGFFNPGNFFQNFSSILGSSKFFTNGSYNPTRTSNIPWFFSCSFAYSASDLGSGNAITASNQLYHSASKYTGAELTTQNFTIDSTDLTTPQSVIFRPSPLITDLNPDLFTTTYNQFVPGDSSSADNTIGGHPKIKVGSTSSIDFHFPSLTIGGTKRTLLPPIPKEIPFSGSSINSSNTSFTITSDTITSNYNGQANDPDGTNHGMSFDGTQQVKNSKIVSLFSSVYGDDIAGQSLTKLDLYYDLEISASVQNYTASIAVFHYADSDPTQNSAIYKTGSPKHKANSNGRINVSNQQRSILLTPAGASTNDVNNVFRIEVESPIETFDVFVNTFSGYYKARANYSPEAGGGSTPFRRFPNSGESFQASLSTVFGASNNTQEFTSSFTPSGDVYPTIDVVAQLRRTGSNTPTGGFIITQSAALISQSIFGTKTFTFSDSPITSIFNATPTGSGNTNTGSTINEANDMYFIAYSMSNYNAEGAVGGVNNTFETIFTETGDTGSKLILEQRAEGVATGNEYNLTASLLIAHGNEDNVNSLGTVFNFGSFIVPESESVARAIITGSFIYPYRVDDVFRMGLSVSKSFGSGLSINEATMSIYPSSSIYAPRSTPAAYNNFNPPTASGFIVPTYFGANIQPFNLALDCQPLLNNYNAQRENTYLMQVDYNNITGSLYPVNQAQILNNTATKASIPDSNYTMLRSINPRYDGSKSTSALYNVFTAGDKGTLGKNPTIDLKKAFFGYFNGIDDPYPMVNDKIQLNVRYLVDEQGNALPPALEGTSRVIFERVFPIKGDSRIAIETGDKVLKELNAPYEIAEIGNYYTPIMYTQTSSNGNAMAIPLTGSGRISRFDNDDPNSADAFSFTALGTASNAPSAGVTSFNYIISPTEQISIGTAFTPNLLPKIYGNPTTGFSPAAAGTGTIVFSGSAYAVNQKDLKNAQTINLTTQFVTSYLYDADRSSNGNEATVFLKMVSGSAFTNEGGTPVPFVVKDIKLSVLKSNQKVYSLGSVMGEKFVRFIGVKPRPKTRKRPQGGYVYSNSPDFTLRRDNTAQIQLSFEVKNFMRNKGVYQRDGDIRFRNPDLLSLIWTVEASSGRYIFKNQDQIRFEMSGAARPARHGNQPDTVFFPDDHVGVYDPTKISVQGALDHIFEGDNTGSAPFWVYTGSAGGGLVQGATNILVMSSSNVNEAYGMDFYQGQLPYTPGPSEIFPGGKEPSNTAFDPIVYPLLIEPGDEIRFANNENYTYKITEVFSPDQNIEGIGSTGKGRIKIVLDNFVPEDVNKNFFLIRRRIPNANSVFLQGTFPYQNTNASGSTTLKDAQSTPGILYPDYPTVLLENSASVIVNELVSKGLIT